MRPAVLRALLAVFLILAALPASAQEGSDSTATLTAVDASHFPQISAFVKVSDAAGARLPGLTARDFRLVENGQPVGNLTVTEEDVGVQVVFVLDTSDAFRARDVNAVTRLQHLQNDLAAYAQTGLRAGVDDVTILAAEGPVVTHADNPGVVQRAVEGYSSEFAGVADPFTLLNWGLDFASDATRQPGMRRLLIFISNGLPQTDISGHLANAASRSAAAQVRIFTMYVGPEGGEATTGANNLLRLAQAGGGERLLFRGGGSLAPFTDRLPGEGRQYRLSYRSRLATTGQHTLAVQATLPDGAVLNSAEVTFPLRVEAPVVRLGDLPASLVRVAASAEAGAAEAEPAFYAVPISVDFPDGHGRGLLSAELLVDGVVVASVAATDSLAALIWPLASYVESAEHTVQAHIIDELGLAAETRTATVSVSLQAPAAPAPVPAPVQLLRQPGVPLLALAVSGLVLALAVGGLAWRSVARRNRAQAEAEVDTVQAAPARLRLAAREPTPAKPPPADATVPVQPTRPAVRRAAPGRAEAALADGATTSGAPPKSSGLKQTAPLAHPPRPSLGAMRPRLRWPGRAGVTHGAARLEVVESGGGSAPRADIELGGETLTLGRDGALAEMVFHDRSVSRLHARLVALNGVFLIYDAGSTSGTWVNYAPVPAETGHALQDGDLINLGRVQLRFRRGAAPSAANGARVTRVAPGGAEGGPPPGNVQQQSADAPPRRPPPPVKPDGTVEKPE